LIRRAVGAIVFQKDEILLVHKVKRIEATNELDSFQAEWDFPKGGVKDGEPLQDAILRELYEETGSTAYQIVEAVDETICFSFDALFTAATGYTGQVTTMFIVEYTGDRTDLTSQDEEINDIQFIHKDNVLDYLSHEETRAFYKRNCYFNL
jgi:putative (di)nucleoside polyphosphate hydrolase